VKFLVLLPTYARPEMVKVAINSVLNNGWDDFELFIVDDNERKTVDPELFADPHLTYCLTGDSVEDKRNRGEPGIGGSRHGQFMNERMEMSDADACIFLNDDDALIPGYMERLSDWFDNNPDKHYCYSHVRIYDPTRERIEGVGERKLDCTLNQVHSLNPVCQVDCSQVTWRLPTKARFDDVRTRDQDAFIFGQPHQTYNTAPPLERLGGIDR